MTKTREKEMSVARYQVLLEKLELANEMAETAIDDETKNTTSDWRFNRMLGFRSGIYTAMCIMREGYDGDGLERFVESMMN